LGAIDGFIHLTVFNILWQSLILDELSTDRGVIKREGKEPFAGVPYITERHSRMDQRNGIVPVSRVLIHQ
jgi:hypothetical protein